MDEDRIRELNQAAYDFLEDRRATPDPVPDVFNEVLRGIEGLEKGDVDDEFAQFEAIFDQLLALASITNGFRRYLKRKLWANYHYGLPTFDILFPLGVVYGHFGLYDEVEAVFLENHYLNEAFRELYFDMALSLGEKLHLFMRAQASAGSTIGAFLVALAGDEPNQWPTREVFWRRVQADIDFWSEYMDRAHLLLDWSEDYKTKYDEPNPTAQDQLLERFLIAYE